MEEEQQDNGEQAEIAGAETAAFITGTRGAMTAADAARVIIFGRSCILFAADGARGRGSPLRALVADVSRGDLSRPLAGPRSGPRSGP